VQNPTNRALQQFDILAVRPMNDKMLQTACATLEIDLISIDLAMCVASLLSLLSLTDSVH